MTEVEQEVPLEEPPPAEEPVEAPVEPVEGTEDDDEGTEPSEPETHPDEQALFDEKEAEKGRRRIDRAVSTLVKTLQEVLADEAQYLQPCPRCVTDFPGMVWDPKIKQVLPETRAAVMISMGEDPDPVYRADPRASRCPTCDGWGKVATGSRVHRLAALDCEECRGKGTIGPHIVALATTPAPVELAVVHSNGEQASEPPETDPWGRVRGEPLYGVMPGFES